MNVLVTGGLGFIGTHVSQKFSETANVTIIDLPEKVFQYSGNLREKNEIIGCDISHWDSVKKLENKTFDLIVHCAAQSGGYGGLETPQLDCDWNAKGTLNMCELSLRTGKPKIVYTSSVAVYGGGDDLSENDIPSPISNYGVSKLTGELYLDRYKTYGIDTVSLRLFNTYGPGQDLENKRQGVVSIFLEQLLENDNVRMTGSPDRYRDCIHVSDVVNAIVVVSEMSSKISGAINVCNRVPVTMREIVETLGRVMKKEVTIEDVGGYPGDQFGYYGDNTKLRSLGWAPTFSLEEGFNNFYNSVKTLKG